MEFLCEANGKVCVQESDGSFWGIISVSAITASYRLKRFVGYNRFNLNKPWLRARQIMVTYFVNGMFYVWPMVVQAYQLPFC